jgi:hypothetical protein
LHQLAAGQEKPAPARFRNANGVRMKLALI